MPDADRPPAAAELVQRVCDWFPGAARDLPWRRPGTGAWPVMVSEFMLQQTPVARVLEPWRQWVERWPEPSALAADPVSEAIRAWGRLGYPRRAVRLHAAAVAITEHHGGVVPTDHDELLALPGVGGYTAAAVLSFAHRQRHVVLDTNVRRVLARTLDGRAHPDRSPTVAERRQAAALLPDDPARAAAWAASSMELGALVCTARSPACPRCPVADLCRWRALGHPAWDGPPRRGQTWQGTDRQCRGRLLAVLRDAVGTVPSAELLAAWPDRTQASRALAGLVADGLAVEDDHGVGLPGGGTGEAP
ncbi:HhH-GPD family protein [Auraticoccus monumenti]|uniref:Adenine DNA glycosylase n=1 Tax=Auraticoccus monumenti TaxID=675864 RepID=A0A1G6RT50_9ACTN|nr:A/G-specific adenine glycosylase [Auraticoccus monumenti]SDD07157.1 A/G-specific DNA-adenine glycosylase [Auraticoccus monumenti]